MKPTPQLLCRICGDKEELERCFDVLNIAIMHMGQSQQQATLRSMVQPMQYDPNPYMHAQAMPPMYQNSSFLNAQNSQPVPMMQQPLMNPNPYGQYAQPHGLKVQHPPMYLTTVPLVQWDDPSCKSLNIAVMFGGINDAMFLVEPILKMFKGLKAAYRITSPGLNDFTLLDDDNIFDEELYVWGDHVSEEQLKSFSAKLAAMVIRDEQGPYTFQGIPMKYSDLANDLKITDIPEGIGIARYHRASRQQRVEEEEKKRVPTLPNPMDPQDASR